MGELRIHNPSVPGSSPGIRVNFSGDVGSTPTPPPKNSWEGRSVAGHWSLIVSVSALFTTGGEKVNGTDVLPSFQIEGGDAT